MKMKALALSAVAGSFILTGSASAGLTGVSFAVVDLGATGGTTYRFYADFDDPADQLLAVSGNSNVSGFLMTTNTMLMNDGGPFAGTKNEDFVFLGADWDSWVTIGASTFGTNDTDYSPGFLGSDGVSAVIVGSTLSQANNGGWFDSNPSTAENGGHVLIAQFTVADVVGPGEAGDIEMHGTIDYNPAGNPPSSSEFFQVSTPAPGALALLGLAGLAGTRRRRG